jgi:hypothetical protein
MRAIAGVFLLTAMVSGCTAAASLPAGAVLVPNTLDDASIVCFEAKFPKQELHCVTVKKLREFAKHLEAN